MGPFDRWAGSMVRRRRDGDFELTLGEDERALLGQLVNQLRELLSTDSATLVRLFPPPYGDDDERSGDDRPRRLGPVDLGNDVGDQKREREEEDADRACKLEATNGKKGYHLGANQVRGDYGSGKYCCQNDICSSPGRLCGGLFAH